MVPQVPHAVGTGRVDAAARMSVSMPYSICHRFAPAWRDRSARTKYEEVQFSAPFQRHVSVSAEGNAHRAAGGLPVEPLVRLRLLLGAGGLCGQLRCVAPAQCRHSLSWRRYLLRVSIYVCAGCPSDTRAAPTACWRMTTEARGTGQPSGAPCCRPPVVAEPRLPASWQAFQRISVGPSV